MVQFRISQPPIKSENNKNEVMPKKSSGHDLTKATQKARTVAESIIQQKEQTGKSVKVHVKEDGSVVLTIIDKKPVNSSNGKDPFDFTAQFQNTEIIEIDKNGNIKTPNNNEPQFA